VTTGARTFKPDARELAGRLRAAGLVGDGRVFEVRAVKASVPSYRRRHTRSGFFDADHLEDAVAAALTLDQSAAGVYFTMNPLTPDLLARRANRIDAADEGGLATDRDVLCRRLLLIDADPQRPDGISATDAEKATALGVVESVRDHLLARGWPAMVLADSGNGYHLLPRIDLPNDDEAREVVRRVLLALAARFTTAAVKIDAKVFNAARITKLYGTLARKGDDGPGRPHRRSGIIDVPHGLAVVPRERLEDLAAEAPTPEPKRSAAANGWTPPLAVDRARVIDRARKYVARMPAAVSGQGGHTATFEVAQVLLRGFDLTDAEAWPILVGYSDRCSPPWSERELRHKLANARHNSRLPAGYLLNGDDRPTWGPAARASANGTGHADPADGPGDAWEGDDGPGLADAAPPAEPDFDFIDSRTFASRDCRPSWLIRRLLVKGQPCVLGGPQKTLKTSVLIDLAVSMATGCKALGYFDPGPAARVGVLSGESGEAALQNTFTRVCAARGVDRVEASIFWGFRLPSLADPLQLARLAGRVKAYRLDALLLDPLYLALLSGVKGAEFDAKSLYDIGPLLMRFGEFILGAGATPVLCHHFKQTRENHFAEPDLGDLTYAGIREYARQWILLGRRWKYEHDGRHQLHLVAGGSMGHSYAYALDVNEGVMGEDFGGRVWETTVAPAGDARRHERESKDRQKAEKRAQSDREDERAVLAALDRVATADGVDPETVGCGYNRVQNVAGLSDTRMSRAVERLRVEGLIEFCPVVVYSGTGRKVAQSVKGLRRVAGGG
jgi:hypothetical protein